MKKPIETETSPSSSGKPSKNTIAKNPNATAPKNKSSNATTSKTEKAKVVSKKTPQKQVAVQASKTSSDSEILAKLEILRKDLVDLDKDYKSYKSAMKTEMDTVRRQFESVQSADLELILRCMQKALRNPKGFQNPIRASRPDKLPVTAVHGHEMMITLILDDYLTKPVEDFAKKHILEIGMTRETVWSQCSTSRLACLARMIGTRFTSVDMDENNVKNAEYITKMYHPYATMVCDLGEDYLAKLEPPYPTYIYLDAYDFEHPNHSEGRQNRYKKVLGQKISNEACWEMHLKCCKRIAEILPDYGIIVFDDVWHENGRWTGKGGTAMPFLLTNGFHIVAQTPKTVALKRNRFISG
ncbi:MAG: hypothetical protein HKO02_08615 [Hyphomonadaceae bacterium]|nr:hypothetical protein [Hyphomonadaceae bacterium]